MGRILTSLVLICISFFAVAQQNVQVQKASDGFRLLVDGKPFMINGMNWDYFPIGTNYSYSLWNQPEDVIKGALDAEMSMLKNMGVNAVRMYTGVQPKWITYIYETYGIYTMLNHSFGRYGLTINGAWVEVTDYRDPATKELLMSEATQLVEEYKGTPGLLLFLLGNENNYGLFWAGAETEDFPDDEEEKKFIGEARGRPMYKLMNDAAVKMKSIDPNHPVAICNGDLLFAEIIAQECQDVDIYGVNMYRGISFGDAFDRVRNELDLPIMFTEFGADAYNAKDNAEDQASQAYYNLGNWREIYENAAGLGKAGNSIGGFTFQFSDGWWKYGQTKQLDVHNNNASWANGGYQSDFQEGENNMNEEWFGICAKGQTNSRGLYTLYPRASYYALQDAHSYDVFAPGASLMQIDDHFSDIVISSAVMKARGDKASLLGERGGKIRISELRAEFSTFNTGGRLITTPESPDPTNPTFPDDQGFDRMESYFIGIEAKPQANVQANVTFNVLGNVAQNPINELFYESRGRAQSFVDVNGQERLLNPDRIQVYQASYSWDNKMFRLEGFYRTGHYHWGYEGDFFGLYPEANYGPNLDIYGGFAPNGFEVEGKRQLKGLKVAFGPELWWGANPAILVKYSKEVGKFNLTGIFHEDLDDPGAAVTSIAVPAPRTRRASIYAERKFGKLEVQAGGLWGGQPLEGREFQVVRGTAADYQVLTDQIKSSDLWGGKLKLTYEGGRFNWYGQGSSRGLVANAGGDYTQTLTGWRLKDFGSGNVNNIFTGFTYSVGKFQIAPNFMWQQPLIDPIDQFALEDGSPARLRNILDDPFVVRSNRETQAAEILITFDPTPGSWMYQWDNDRAEDAPLAVSLGFVYWHLPTSQDAAVIFPGDGRTPSAAAGAAPATDLWEVNARIVSKITPEFGIITRLYGGTAQANGGSGDPSDAVNRRIERYGGELRTIYKKVKFS
ncbi:MAG: glycosidase, partial [Bacteroidota bacterium]